MTISEPKLKGSTDQSIVLYIIDSTTGLPEQAVEHNTTDIALWYWRPGGTKTAITPAALTALDSAHSDGGIEHIDDGAYRFDTPDAVCATGVNFALVGGSIPDMIIIPTFIPLDDVLARIGTPVALDGAAATLAAMLTKIADDNGGADYNAETDSLEKIRGGLATAGEIADAVHDEPMAGHTDAGSAGKALADILDDTSTSGVVLANDAITAAKIAANAIGASELATDAVAEIVNAIVGATIEGAYDLGDMLRLIASGVFCSTEDGGLSFRNIANTKDRFNVVIDSSNRTITIADAT